MSLLEDHLEVCAMLARSEGLKLVEYLVRMALLEVRPKKTKERCGN